MVIIKKILNILTTLGATIVFSGIFGLVCLPVVNYSIAKDKAKLNGDRCKTWDKASYDKSISNLFSTFNSYINCNTYYLELENIEVAKLSEIPNKFNYDINIQIVVDNQTSVIMATINQENQLIYTISSK